MTLVRVDDPALALLLRSQGVMDALQSVGDQVADRARLDAPKASGAGAASIHAETAADGSVRVSWDEDHFYLFFSEVGTSRMPARPFLRPALDATYTP